MRNGLLCFISVTAVCLLATQAPASILTYDAILSGPSEAPPNASTGTGSALVTIDNVADTMHVQVNFSGLVSPTTASHIHCCTATPDVGTANVATTIPTFPNFPLGVTSGTYDQTFDMMLTTSYNSAFITANGGTTSSAFNALLTGLNAGDAYLNIHTVMSPGGEIRGFLRAVPEPSTWAMLLLGFVGLGYMGFKQSRRRAAAA